MSGLQDRLRETVTTIALCWRVARRDGATLGFTNADQRLELDGLRYEPAPGMTPSAVVTREGLEPSRLEVTGALSSDAISAADLALGRYDDAVVELFALDWTEPAAGRIVLAAGSFGAVARETTIGGAFNVDLNGVSAALDVPASELCSPECRAQLGDRRCGVDLARHQQRVAVISVQSTTALTLHMSIDDRFSGGMVSPLSGRCAGLDLPVEHAIAGRVVLDGPAPAPLVAGDLLLLTQGCDRRLSTCADRFGNASNFQGEPHLPGTDALSRYGAP